jgi:hypothetical protein
MWPVNSVLAGIFSAPSWFVFGTYLFIKALETGRLITIYVTLFTGVLGGATIWYGLRRLACKVDIVRAQRSGLRHISSNTLEKLIR